MTKDDILFVVRQRAGEVDIATSRFTDADLMKRLRATLRDLQVRKVVLTTGLVVDAEPTSATYGIAPVPTDSVGTLLAYRLVVDVLRETYAKRLAEGSFGISWRSGLEEESSIEAAKHYRNSIAQAQQDADEILLAITAITQATRPY